MKCHYTYDENGKRFFIPYCWPALHGGKEACTCNDFPETWKQFERKEYNEKLAAKNKEIKELEQEIEHLHNVIKKQKK